MRRNSGRSFFLAATFSLAEIAMAKGSGRRHVEAGCREVRSFSPGPLPLKSATRVYTEFAGGLAL